MLHFLESYFFDKCVHDLDFTLKIFPAWDTTAIDGPITSIIIQSYEGEHQDFLSSLPSDSYLFW